MWSDFNYFLIDRLLFKTSSLLYRPTLSMHLLELIVLSSNNNNDIRSISIFGIIFIGRVVNRLRFQKDTVSQQQKHNIAIAAATPPSTNQAHTIPYANSIRAKSAGYLISVLVPLHSIYTNFNINNKYAERISIANIGSMVVRFFHSNLDHVMSTTIIAF